MRSIEAKAKEAKAKKNAAQPVNELFLSFETMSSPKPQNDNGDDDGCVLLSNPSLHPLAQVCKCPNEPCATGRHLLKGTVPTASHGMPTRTLSSKSW